MAFDYDKSFEAEKEKYHKIHEALKATENNIIFPFLDIYEYPLELTDGCTNQILLLYRSGRFEVLPRGVTGASIRDYLGIAYSRIVMWSIFPAAGSKMNPVADNKNKSKRRPFNSERDIYEC